MILKDAYHYSNFLSDMIEEAQEYLSDKDFTTKTTEIHDRHKTNKEAPAEPEVIKVDQGFDVDFTPMELVDFLVTALHEKEDLMNAIAIAKKNTDIDIDAAIATNKIRQKYKYLFSNMSCIKASSTQSMQLDYKFDVNGEQKPYKYPVTKNTAIDFDRDDIKGLVKKFTVDANNISTKLDIIELTTEVDFTPRWTVDSTLDDIIDWEKSQ